MKTLIIVALCSSLATTLAACGGGSSPSVDNSAAIAQAVTNIAQQQPPAPKPYTGGFANSNGVATGFISGTSVDDVAKNIAQNVANHSLENAAAYRAMLSEAGLRIIVYGGLSDVKGVSGTFISLPDSVFVARVGRDGLVVITRV